MVVNGPGQCNDILRGDIVRDCMDRCEKIASTRSEVVDHPTDLSFN